MGVCLREGLQGDLKAIWEEGRVASYKHGAGALQTKISFWDFLELQRLGQRCRVDIFKGNIRTAWKAEERDRHV